MRLCVLRVNTHVAVVRFVVSRATDGVVLEKYGKRRTERELGRRALQAARITHNPFLFNGLQRRVPEL